MERPIVLFGNLLTESEANLIAENLLLQFHFLFMSINYTYFLNFEVAKHELFVVVKNNRQKFILILVSRD